MRQTILSIIATIVFSSVIFGAVHQSEYVTKKEVYAWADKCKEKLDSFTTVIGTSSETDSYIWKLISENKTAKKIHDEAMKQQKSGGTS